MSFNLLGTSRTTAAIAVVAAVAASAVVPAIDQTSVTVLAAER